MGDLLVGPFPRFAKREVEFRWLPVLAEMMGTCICLSRTRTARRKEIEQVPDMQRENLYCEVHRESASFGRCHGLRVPDELSYLVPDVLAGVLPELVLGEVANRADAQTDPVLRIDPMVANTIPTKSKPTPAYLSRMLPAST